MLRNSGKGGRHIGYKTMLWLFMGAALFVMAVVYGIGYYWYYQNSIRETAEKNALTIRVAEKDLDNKIKAITETTQNLRGDYDLLAALIDPSPYYDYRLSQKLSTYVGIHGVLDIAVFDSFSDTAYSAYGQVEKDRYFTRIANIGDRKEGVMEQIRAPTDTSSFHGFMTVRIYDKPGTYQAAVYIDPISTTRKIVYLVDKSVFVSPVDSILQGREGSFFVLDASGSPVLSMGINRPDPEPLVPEEWEEHIDVADGGLQVAQKNGDLYYATKSKTSAFWYVIVTNREVFHGGLQALRNSLFLTVAVMLALGALLSILFSRVSYRPIQKLRDVVLSPGEKAGSTGWKDLDSITERFREISSGMEETAQRLDTDREFLYNSLVCGLVNSASSYYFNEKAYQRENIDLSGRWTQVALLQADNIQPAAVLAAVQGEGGVACYLSDKNEYGQLIAVLHGDEKAALFRAILAVGEKCREEGVRFYIGAGQAVDEIHQIRLSFSQAATALREDDENPIRFYKNEGMPDSSRGRLQSVRPQLNAAIRSGDMDTVEGLVRGLFENIPDHTGQSFLYSDLIYFLLVLARSEGAPDSAIAGAVYATHQDTKGMIEAVLYLAKGLGEELMERPEEKSDKFMQEVVEYIRGHFRDNSLSAQHIAEHFKVSVSHLNRHVKNVSGKTVFAIMDSMRMENAMHLLVATDLPVREIVDRSGYGDVNYFTRKFRKATGLSPGQYRRVQGDA